MINLFEKSMFLFPSFTALSELTNVIIAMWRHLLWNLFSQLWLLMDRHYLDLKLIIFKGDVSNPINISMLISLIINN